jgi:hypothetical protein
MGSFYEINDTLVISKAQGFPSHILNIETHQKKPITLKEVEGKVFSFNHKSAARAFQLDPVRVYLVERTAEKKWLFWGLVYIQSISITRAADAPDNKRGDSGGFNPDDWVTAGTFKIVEIYEPEYQKVFTKHESPAAWNYFAGSKPERNEE